MGLDSVEMVIAVEDKFGVTIPDAKAIHIETVGDLYLVVLSLRASVSRLKCKTQYIFYRFRASLPHHLREQCRPDSLLKDFFRDTKRRKMYDELASDVSLQFPPLLAPKWLPGLNVVFLPIVGILTIAVYLNTGSALLATFVPLLGFYFAIGYLGVHYQLSTVLPADSVRTFIESTSQLNYHRVLPKFKDDEEVLNELRSLIVDKLGVDESEITMSAHFQRDLGVD